MDYLPFGVCQRANVPYKLRNCLFVMQRLGIPAFDEDMFQIGSIGLLKAIDTFDASKDVFLHMLFDL